MFDAIEFDSYYAKKSFSAVHRLIYSNFTHRFGVEEGQDCSDVILKSYTR